MSDQHKPSTNKGRSFHEVDLAGMREAIGTGDRLLGIGLHAWDADGNCVEAHGRGLVAAVCYCSGVGWLSWVGCCRLR